MDISLRQLYRLFEQENDSVCRYIQRARLHSVAKDLGNPFMREKSLTDIAYAWGFSDSAHFSRSFKRQFELSPRDFRSQLQQAPATYLS
jgi:AraC-like DNA-binding protein